MAIPVIEGTPTDNQNDSNSATLTLAVPSGTASGDTLVAVVINETGGWGAESGWLREWYENGPDVDMAVYTRAATGSEPTDYTFDCNSTENGGWMFRISGTDPIFPISVLGPVDTSSPVAGIVTQHDDSLVMFFTGGDGQDTVPMTFGGTGWTGPDSPELNAGTGNQGVGCAYESRGEASAGTVPDVTVTHTTADGLIALMLAISEDYTTGGTTGIISHVGDVVATSASATAITPDFSGESWAENDLLVASCYMGNDTPTWSAPDGTWTQRINGSSSGGDDRRLTVFTKLAGASEDETPTFGLSSATPGTVVIDIYRGCDTTTPVEAASASASMQTNNNQPRGPVLTSLTDGAWFIDILGTHSDASYDEGPPIHATMRADYVDFATYPDRGIATASTELPVAMTWYPRQWQDIGSGGNTQECALGSLVLKPADPAQTLTGALFSKPPSFIAGQINLTISGVLFSNAPVFPTGAITTSTTVTGVLFTNAPVFPTGTLAATNTLSGTVFTNPPVFPATGSITVGGVTVSGVLFSNPPVFISGQVVPGSTIAGVLFSNPPVFPTGVLTSTITINGVLFTNAPAFISGTVTSTNTISGVLFTNAPSFISGVITAGGVTITGVLFANPPVFISGAVTLSGQLDGVLFTNPPVFLVGTVSGDSAEFVGWGIPIGI